MSTKDLSFIDKLLQTVDMDELGMIDVEKLKDEVADSEDEREKVVLEVLEEVGQDRGVFWTDFLGLLKVFFKSSTPPLDLLNGPPVNLSKLRNFKGPWA